MTKRSSCEQPQPAQDSDTSLLVCSVCKAGFARDASLLCDDCWSEANAIVDNYPDEEWQRLRELLMIWASDKAATLVQYRLACTAIEDAERLRSEAVIRRDALAARLRGFSRS